MRILNGFHSVDWQLALDQSATEVRLELLVSSPFDAIWGLVIWLNLSRNSATWYSTPIQECWALNNSASMLGDLSNLLVDDGDEWTFGRRGYRLSLK